MKDPVRPRPRSFVVQWGDGVYALVVGGEVKIVSYAGERAQTCPSGAKQAQSMWLRGTAGVGGMRGGASSKIGMFS